MSSEQYYARRCLSVPLHHPIALGTNDTAAVQTRFIVQHSGVSWRILHSLPQTLQVAAASPRLYIAQSPCNEPYCWRALGNPVLLVVPTHSTSVPCNGWAFHRTHCTYLWTWSLWIRASWHDYENNQQDALGRLIYYSSSALHVSGDVFAHHQERLTIFTVSDSVHTSCCRLVPAATWVNTTRHCKYSQVLLMTDEKIARNM